MSGHAASLQRSRAAPTASGGRHAIRERGTRTTVARQPWGPDTKVLIVVFSRTGLSRKVADGLSALLAPAACNLEVVREVHPHRDGTLRRAIDALFHRTPPVAPRELHPWRYDLIVVGGPVHAGTVAAPLRSFLRGLAVQGSRVAFFLVGSRRRCVRAFAELQHHFRSAPVARVLVPAPEVLHDLHLPRLRTFCAALASALQDHPGGTRNAAPFSDEDVP